MRPLICSSTGFHLSPYQYWPKPVPGNSQTFTNHESDLGEWSLQGIAMNEVTHGHDTKPKQYYAKCWWPIRKLGVNKSSGVQQSTFGTVNFWLWRCVWNAKAQTGGSLLGRSRSRGAPCRWPLIHTTDANMLQWLLDADWPLEHAHTHIIYIDQ